MHWWILCAPQPSASTPQLPWPPLRRAAACGSSCAPWVRPRTPTSTAMYWPGPLEDCAAAVPPLQRCVLPAGGAHRRHFPRSLVSGAWRLMASPQGRPAS